MNSRRSLLAVWGLVVVFWAAAALAQTTIKKEIDVGFSDIETVRPLLKKSLSPIGKFVMLPGKGSVMVIDTPDGILRAEQALLAAELPLPDVALDFRFVTGLPPRKQQLTVAQEVPFPVEYAPPTIIVGPSGPTAVIPATPTRFQKRNIGVTSEVSSSINPDGSITLDIDFENSEFEGFVNYGSAVLPAGGIGTVPMVDQVGDPTFFTPFINAGDMKFPIISTTRVSTSIVIRPRVELGTVYVDAMPRFTILLETEEAEPQTVDLQKYRISIPVRSGQVGRVYGFEKAGDDFNRRFFGAEDPDTGSTAIVVKATIQPPGTKKGLEEKPEKEEE